MRCTCVSWCKWLAMVSNSHQLFPEEEKTVPCLNALVRVVNDYFHVNATT